jgi:ubiquinone/menaquinone biosynthesis C-methylase UbiE
VNVRENALCPGCLALERHRIMWLYLKNKTNFFTKQNKVLHIAPEQCFLKRFRKLKNLEYHTADLVSPIADFKCDVQNMPFKDSTYDIVICNHVLEHVDDDITAMKEILRVLKPGGFAIMQVPADFNRKKTFSDNNIKDKKQRTEIFGQYDHLRVYGRDYPEIIQKAGFIIDEPNYTDLLTEDEKNRYSLYIKEFMFASKKG